MSKTVTGFDYTPPPDGLRDFDDPDTVRSLIYDGAMDNIKKRFPMSDGKHRLELTDLKYDGPRTFSMADQKRAMLTERSLRTPMKGKWKLIDEATGAVKDEKEDVVMHVPYYTDRGTFVHQGNDIVISAQNRLKPGVYVRTKRTGEHEAQFNIKPGTGSGFRMRLEPESGIFKIDVAQASVPAYQFLNAMGVPDKDMEDAWGAELLAKNMEKQDGKAVEKLVARFAPYREAVQGEDLKAALQEVVGKMEIDPWVAERTLGVRDTKNVTPALLVRASKKLLNVNRGDEQDDDRDAPEFSNVYTVEDFLNERIEKDAGRLAKNLLFKMRRSGNLKAAGRGVFTPYYDSFIYGSGLSSSGEETNPLSILEQTHRQIKFGEGGIGDEHMLTEEAREVNPGQVGFVDTIASSESTRIGADLRFAYRTFKGKDKQIYGEFQDAKTGKMEYLKPEDMAGKTLAFPGQEGADKVYALKNAKMIETSPDEVDYVVPSSAHMYGSGINMVPMPTGFMPGRAFYASKYWSQFLPVVNGETPLVKAAMPGKSGRSFSEFYGRRVACVNSPAKGVVTRVSDMGVTVTDADGQKHVVETVKDFPYNRLTALTHTAVVKEGDKVEHGDLLAKSNFTDDKGEFNMGVNLKVAVIPDRGRSFEDAYSLSESAARRLTTEQLYGFDVDSRRGVKINRGTYLSAFPKTYTNDQMDKLDKAGVVKPGQTVSKGDPLILATGPRTLSAEDAQLGRLHKILRNSLKDHSVTWDYDLPGVVTDVALTARGAKVNVKTQAPVRVGDKIVTMGSSKGVVGSVRPDEEMPRDPETGEPYELMFNPMAVLSRQAPNQIVEMNLAKVAKKMGKPYLLPQDPPPEGWAKFARSELDKNGLKESRDIYDPVTGKTIKNVGEGYMYIAPFHHLAEKKLCVLEDGTEIMTDEGWVKSEDVKPKHLICTRDPKTGRPDYRHPVMLNRYNVDGQSMYHVEDSAQDMEVTASHRVVVDQASFRMETAEMLYNLCSRGLL